MEPVCSVGVEFCPICSSGFEPWRTKSTPCGDFRIVRCVGCGFAFVNPRPSLDYLREFNSEAGHGDSQIRSIADLLKREREYPNSSLDAKRIFNTIVDFLEREPTNRPRRCLDVGCGYGFFSKGALSRGFEVLALERASTERSLAKQMTGLNPTALSFEEFSDSEGGFMAILMSQVLEHALDVNAWIEKAHRLLASGGVLAIALPNFASIFRLVLQKRDPYIVPPAHLNFFSPQNLSTFLTKYGFRVLDIQWVSRIDPNVVYRRVPGTRWFDWGIHLPLKAILKSLDKLHLGMMINVYGRK